jgi:hypothetical protein
VTDTILACAAWCTDIGRYRNILGFAASMPLMMVGLLFAVTVLTLGAYGIHAEDMQVGQENAGCGGWNRLMVR